MMKVSIEYDITDCTDCPFTYEHRGHGEFWTECVHKDNGRKHYKNILWGMLDTFKSIPEWCPIFKGEIK